MEPGNALESFLKSVNGNVQDTEGERCAEEREIRENHSSDLRQLKKKEKNLVGLQLTTIFIID